MARNRMIKADLPDDEKLGRVSPLARLLFILSWTVADDTGVFRGDSKYLKSRIFPYDDIAPDEINKMLTELEDNGMIIEGSYNLESYYIIKNFGKHQRIDKPSKTTLLDGDYNTIFGNVSEIFQEPSEKKQEGSAMKRSRSRSKVKLNKKEVEVEVGASESPQPTTTTEQAKKILKILEAPTGSGLEHVTELLAKYPNKDLEAVALKCLTYAPFDRRWMRFVTMCGSEFDRPEPKQEKKQEKKWVPPESVEL